MIVKTSEQSLQERFVNFLSSCYCALILLTCSNIVLKDMWSYRVRTKRQCSLWAKKQPITDHQISTQPVPSFSSNYQQNVLQSIKRKNTVSPGKQMTAVLEALLYYYIFKLLIMQQCIILHFTLTVC